MSDPERDAIIAAARAHGVEPGSQADRTRRWRRSIVIGLALLVLLLGPVAIELSTDWWWFAETGYQTTFLRILTLRGVLGIVAMAAAFVVMLVDMRVAMRRFSPRQLICTTREGPIAVAFDSRLARTASVVVAGVLAVLIGLYASSRWLDWLFFLHGQPFGAADPVLGRDAGFMCFGYPSTPARKDNLASWMVARSDGDNYGRMIVFRFPKQKVVFGPRQIVARINQDQAIAPQITLWNQQGSEVLQGTLLVIPIEESLIYIRPLYLRSAGGRIPELKRVILAHQNQIVMEETLDKALDRLFPADGPGRRSQRVPSLEIDERRDRPVPEYDTFTAQAVEHYRNAIQAQRDGNWGRYGDEIRRLGEVLEKIRPR